MSTQTPGYYRDLLENILKEDPETIERMKIIRLNRMSESEQIDFLKENGVDQIRHIKNPSEQVQLAAVDQDVYAIQFIKNPTPDVIALAKSKGYDQHGNRL